MRLGSAGTPALWWDYSSGAAELVQRLPDFDSVLAGSREALLVTRGPSVELHRRDGTTAQWEGTQGCLRRGRVIVLGSDKRTLSVFDAAEPGSAERSVRLGFSVDWMECACSTAPYFVVFSHARRAFYLVNDELQASPLDAHFDSADAVTSACAPEE